MDVFKIVRFLIMTSISNTLVSNLSFYSLISITNRRKILLIFYQHTSLITSLDLERRYNNEQAIRIVLTGTHRNLPGALLLTWDYLACKEAHLCEFRKNVGRRTSRDSLWEEWGEEKWASLLLHRQNFAELETDTAESTCRLEMVTHVTNWNAKNSSSQPMGMSKEKKGNKPLPPSPHRI